MTDCFDAAASSLYYSMVTQSLLPGYGPGSNYPVASGNIDHIRKQMEEVKKQNEKLSVLLAELRSKRTTNQ